MGTNSNVPVAHVAVSGPAIAAIVVGIAAALAVVVWFFVNRQNPERAATHSDAAATTTAEQLYGGADRPAGPGAEPMNPDLLGGDQRLPGSASPEADRDP